MLAQGGGAGRGCGRLGRIGLCGRVGRGRGVRLLGRLGFLARNLMLSIDGGSYGRR